VIVTELIKKFPTFVWDQNVHYHVHKSPTLVHTLSYMNSAYSLSSYPLIIHFNIILYLFLGIFIGQAF
jgi:hypothetical protein